VPVTLSDLIRDDKLLWVYCRDCGHERERAGVRLRVLRLQEFRSLFNECLVILENAPVSGIVIEYECGTR
jgi:hypothetical protein